MQDKNYNERGYGCFVMVVAAIAILLSIISLLKWDNPHSGLSGEDYTIAALSTLITFVVAWQIWQTITSRDEVRDLAKRNEEVKRKLQNENQKIKQTIEEFKHSVVDANKLIAEELKKDYESSMAVMDTLAYLRNFRSAAEMFDFAVKTLRRLLVKENLKATALVRAIETSASDILTEPEKYPEFAKKISAIDLYWLRCFDYKKSGYDSLFGNLDNFISNIDKLIDIHRAHCSENTNKGKKH